MNRENLIQGSILLTTFLCMAIAIFIAIDTFKESPLDVHNKLIEAQKKVNDLKVSVDSLENIIPQAERNINANYRELFRIGYIRGAARASDVVSKEGEWNQQHVKKYYRIDSLWSEQNIFGTQNKK